MKKESLASISTNETTPQQGFMLFTASLLFGLVPVSILEHITAKEEVKAKTKEEISTLNIQS